MAQVQSLAWELLYATGAAKKKKEKKEKKKKTVCPNWIALEEFIFNESVVKKGLADKLFHQMEEVAAKTPQQ